MKYKFYCAINTDNRVIDFLQTRNIKHDIDPIRGRMYFTIYSDTDGSGELLNYIRPLTDTSIAKSSVYSNQEIEAARWYLLCVTRMGIETKRTDFTYDAKCLFSTAYGMKRYYHFDQKNPFVSKKTPKWKSGYNFCSLETGNMTRIFCSDYAKDTILKNEINGVDFMPVLKGDLITPTPNVSQLVFKNKLPLEAYTFIGKYSELKCPMCGRVNYIFEEPNCDTIRLNIDKLPEGIDVFGSEITVGYGHGEEPIAVSKKFYNLIVKDLKEKINHLIIQPIA